jgi:hypothetical protein
VELLGRNPVSKAVGTNPKLIQRAGRARQKAKGWKGARQKAKASDRGRDTKERESRCMWQELEYIS